MCVYWCLDYSVVEKLKLNGRGHSTYRDVYHLLYIWVRLFNWGLRIGGDLARKPVRVDEW